MEPKIIILTDANFPMICGHASGKLFSMASKILGLEKHASFEWVYQSVFN